MSIPGYEVRGELARGGMGRVLEAYDLTFGREVAIKVVLPGLDAAASAGRFVRESRITGRLTHPGIPPAYQLGELPDGSPFLAMKLVRGRTLAQLLAERPDVGHDLPRFVAIFEQVCQAVGYAHSRGIIHRDLKPANVMVGAFGEVQVMDWGLARDTHAGSPHPDSPPVRPWDATGSTIGDDRTQAGAVMGTPAYMAPEQARGEEVAAGADVFALGGILCEVLTGSRPFRGSSGAEVVAKAAAGEMSDALVRIDACGADAELIDVARRCLSPAAADRPTDGTVVAGLVAAYRAGVEERLRAAERDRVAAEARASEEANTRREAEARADAVRAKEIEQRMRQRTQRRLVGAVLAAVVLAGFGVALGALWRDAESARAMADGAKKEAELSRDEAIDLRREADKARAEAVKLRGIADAGRDKEANLREIAEKATQQAETLKGIAIEARKDVRRSEERLQKDVAELQSLFAAQRAAGDKDRLRVVELEKEILGYKRAAEKARDSALASEQRARVAQADLLNTQQRLEQAMEKLATPKLP